LGGLLGVLPVYTSSVQTKPSTGTSVESAIEAVDPAPLQTAFLQSPLVWLDSGVLAATGSVPHRLLMHARKAHWEPDAGHWAGSVHSTQSPAPMQ